jgi:hypothetical protein
MNEPEDPILAAAAEIVARGKRLREMKPRDPLLTARHWIGLLRPGEGFVEKRETPTPEHNEDEEEDTKDSDPHEDAAQDDGSPEDEWTDALAVTSGYDEQEFIRFFDEIHDDIVSRRADPMKLPTANVAFHRLQSTARPTLVLSQD